MKVWRVNGGWKYEVDTGLSLFNFGGINFLEILMLESIRGSGCSVLNVLEWWGQGGILVMDGGFILLGNIMVDWLTLLIMGGGGKAEKMKVWR